MAGITGILCKDYGLMDNSLHEAFYGMLGKLYYSKSQLFRDGSCSLSYFGNSLPISKCENTHFQTNIYLGVVIIIEGVLYIDNETREKLFKKYEMSSALSDYQLLPWLYHAYGADLVNNITGCYNVFVNDSKTGRFLLFNDRLGYLPLYYYENEKYFLFASKIECILASGLMNNIELEPATFAEHLYFNYPLSECTYIKGISTLPSATILEMGKGSTTIKKSKYWRMSSLFGKEALNKKESFQRFNEGLRKAIQKGVSNIKEVIPLSLTGGWDSRVVLSYLLPENRERLYPYSFGAPGSDDIEIPLHIAKQEHISYTPFILDNEYLAFSFPREAIDTIMLSNGTRGYKRAHYLYAMRKLSNFSDSVVTGVFGDEVFKVSQSVGGEVLSQNTINFLQSDFNVAIALKEVSKHALFPYLSSDKKAIIRTLEERLSNLRSEMEQYNSISEKYYTFRFEYNLRKYFGNEANSYNDFVNAFSPFIDYNFLEAFSETEFFGTRFPFNSNSLLLKRKATQLYYEIIRANCPKLADYQSARGYTMKAAATLTGQLKILFMQNLGKKQKAQDGYNTKPTDAIFSANLIATTNLQNSIFNKHATDDSPISDKLNSLYFWADRIANNYGLPRQMV